MSDTNNATSRLEHFIGGDSSPSDSSEWIPTFDPETGSVQGEVSAGNATDVHRAALSAHDAWPRWRDRRPGDRGRVLTAIARRIVEDREYLIALERAQTGKPASSAGMEIDGAARYFEYYGGLADALTGESLDLGAGYHSYTRREPYGVVGVIVPWNAPLNQAARAIAPALTVGNVVVAKPAEETSATCLALAELAVDCGLPAGALNVVTGLGPVVGEAIVNHDLVRMVAFTGSVATGRRVAHLAAERLIPVTLELGGKSPNIVFEDAPTDLAVAGVLRGFTANAGQLCIAGTRLLVQSSICDRLVTLVAEAADRLAIGSAEGPPVIGPAITKAQYYKVQQFRKIAQQEGARAVTKRPDPTSSDEHGWHLAPTVFDKVSPTMRIAREEIFGPILAAMPFEDEDDAVAIANDSIYGLAAGIWTNDLGRAHRVAARLEAGQVYVNEYYAGGVETPLGGYKQSGIGREKGLEALRHYTQLKCVTIKL